MLSESTPNTLSLARSHTHALMTHNIFRAPLCLCSLRSHSLCLHFLWFALLSADSLHAFIIPQAGPGVCLEVCLCFYQTHMHSNPHTHAGAQLTCHSVKTPCSASLCQSLPFFSSNKSKYHFPHGLYLNFSAFSSSSSWLFKPASHLTCSWNRCFIFRALSPCLSLPTLRRKRESCVYIWLVREWGFQEEEKTDLSHPSFVRKDKGVRGIWPHLCFQVWVFLVKLYNTKSLKSINISFMYTPFGF